MLGFTGGNCHGIVNIGACELNRGNIVIEKSYNAINVIFVSFKKKSINEVMISAYLNMIVQPGPVIMKLFSCSTQLSMKFQLLIKTKKLKTVDFLGFKVSDSVFILLTNVKMPTIVGILTFMNRKNFHVQLS